MFIPAFSVFFFFQFTQVILQSETIQELTKTSEALALLQEEAAELRKLADALKTENVRPLFAFLISSFILLAQMVVLLDKCF